MVITRVFKGAVQSSAVSDFVRYLADIAVPQFLLSPGVKALEVHLPADGGNEFAVATLWRDEDHVKRFAGEDWAKPHVEPEEGGMLLSASVAHFIGDDRPGPLFTPLEAPAAHGSGDGRIRLDPRRAVAHVEGHAYELPPREFRLMEALVASGGRPLDPKTLVLNVWPDGACMTSDDLRRVVHKLRLHLGDHRRERPLIRTRRGLGYLLDL